MGHQADTASYYWTTFLRLDPARYRLTNPRQGSRPLILERAFLFWSSCRRFILSHWAGRLRPCRCAGGIAYYRRRGDRIALQIAAVHESAFGT